MNLRALFGRPEQPPTPPPTTPGVGGLLCRLLRDVTDPELGVSIVDLGLVYGVSVEEGAVRVTLTMTTPACPMSRLITNAIRHALRRAPDVESVEIDLVWSPRWSPDMAAGTAALLFPYR